MANRVKILLVEDDVLVAGMMQDRLMDMGYEVVGAMHSGEETLTFVASHPLPDLLLMDIDLSKGGGKIDGIETAQEVMKQYSLPIIYLSSFSDKETIARAKESHAATYLLKPFKEKDAQVAIEMALANYTGTNNSQSEMEDATDSEQDDAFLIKDCIFIKEEQVYVKITIEDILFLEASKNYVIIHTANKDYVLCNTLAYATKLINHPYFFRCHQSYLANLAKMDAFEKDGIYIGKHVLPISRSNQASFLQHLQILKSK